MAPVLAQIVEDLRRMARRISSTARHRPARRLHAESSSIGCGLEAIHLAVVLDDCPTVADGLEIVFVTRDTDQARAAKDLGLALR